MYYKISIFLTSRKELVEKVKNIYINIKYLITENIEIVTPYQKIGQVRISLAHCGFLSNFRIVSQQEE